MRQSFTINELFEGLFHLRTHVNRTLKGNFSRFLHTDSRRKALLGRCRKHDSSNRFQQG